MALPQRNVTISWLKQSKSGWTDVSDADGFKLSCPPKFTPVLGMSYLVRFSTKQDNYSGMDKNYAIEMTETGAAPPAPVLQPVQPSVAPPVVPPVAAQNPVVPSKYSDKDIEGFKKKDDQIMRLNAMNNACNMVGAYAALCASQKGSEFQFSSREEVEAFLDVMRVKWFHQLEMELTVAHQRQ